MKMFGDLNWRVVVATLGLSGAVSCAGLVMAEDYVDDLHVQETHVHGQASLFIVLEAKKLLVELESPAMNLLGFEHAPHTEEQRQLVKNIQQQLVSVGQLLSFDGGQCQLLTADVEMAAMENDHEESDHDVDHEHHNEKTHGEHEDAEAQHSDIEAKYVFNCQQPATLMAIDVTLFNQFHGVEELTTQWVVRSFQGGKTLNPESSRIELQ
jgi:Protein of unknown function (DUF2796)